MPITNLMVSRSNITLPQFSRILTRQGAANNALRLTGDSFQLSQATSGHSLCRGPGPQPLPVKPRVSERLVTTSESLFQETAIVPAFPDHLLPVFFFFFQKEKRKDYSKIIVDSAQSHNCSLLYYNLFNLGAIAIHCDLPNNLISCVPSHGQFPQESQYESRLIFI